MGKNTYHDSSSLKENKKGTLGLFGLILVLFFVVVAALLVVNWAASGNKLSVGGDDDGDKPKGKFDYTGKNVEVTLSSSNQYTAASIDPTFYVYESKPEHWGNGRQSVEDGYISSLSSSSGSATLTETPGTYYVRAVLSGYYDVFMTVIVPDSGDVSLSEWNDGGEAIEKVKLIDVETLSVSNQDLGIATNETSDKTYHLFSNFNVDDDEGFMLDEIKFQEDATYAFATDTDGDGIYDEGINKIKVTLDGNSWTIFDAAGSIDEFSGDDLAVIDVQDTLYPENGVVSLKFEITCDATLGNAVGDADEKCGNGEDFLDSVILVDAAGNTATFDITG